MNPTPRHLHPSPRSPFLPIPLHYTSEIPVIPFYSLSQHTYPSLCASPPYAQVPKPSLLRSVLVPSLRRPQYLIPRPPEKSLPIGPVFAAPLPLCAVLPPGMRDRRGRQWQRSPGLSVAVLYYTRRRRLPFGPHVVNSVRLRAFLCLIPLQMARRPGAPRQRTPPSFPPFSFPTLRPTQGVDGGAPRRL